ncbi:MAG: diaminopimelate epimerase [Clostridiales bacterium]|nr:diaminopimelate epimerase [Clostridiales bacterium]
MHFEKLHGAGNDYIFVDCLDNEVQDMSALAKRMSDRHFGVGGDGVVFLYPSEVADVKMRMFNADGSEGAMCGNALRCIGRILSGRSTKNEYTVETNSGIRTVLVGKSADTFTVDMGKPQLLSRINAPMDGFNLRFTHVSVGNPHCVILVDDVLNADMTVAAQLQTYSIFTGGVNVEFVQRTGDGLRVRVYERGSGETLSCGTGACAAVVACVKMGLLPRGECVSVHLLGGVLTVNYSENIYLTGKAEKVYEGDYYDKVHFCDRWCSKRTG